MFLLILGKDVIVSGLADESYIIISFLVKVLLKLASQMVENVILFCLIFLKLCVSISDCEARYLLKSF